MSTNDRVFNVITTVVVMPLRLAADLGSLIAKGVAWVATHILSDIVTGPLWLADQVFHSDSESLRQTIATVVSAPFGLPTGLLEGGLRLPQGACAVPVTSAHKKSVLSLTIFRRNF